MPYIKIKKLIIKHMFYYSHLSHVKSFISIFQKLNLAFILYIT